MERLLVGFIAGLSVGVSCVGLCLPVFLPVLLSQKRNVRTSFFILIEFSFGRLLGYLLFGLGIGWLGQVIVNPTIHQLVMLVNIWTGITLILYGLGNIDKRYCAGIPFTKIRWPVLLGFLTGVNVCPPFLASLPYIFNLKSIISSVLYFFMFFLGTTTYIVPFVLLGVLTKITWLQKIAHIAGVLVGLYFIIQSFLSFF